MSESHEIEAKFEADSGIWEQLRSLNRFGSFSLVERSAKQQDDLYYDTADQRLKHAGASLRIRRAGDSAEVTFKGERTPVSPGNSYMVSRLEDEVAVPLAAILDLDEKAPFRLRPVPSPLARGREIAGNVDLFPTARLRTDRAILTFEDDDLDRIEIAMDCCRAIRLRDCREIEFIEIEIELKRGEPSALASAINDLQTEVAGLVPSTRTKLERALGG